MPAKTIRSFNRRGARIGVGCLATLLAFPFVLYFGYCWGLWGRNSLSLQYFFQCNCPPESEEWRYGKQVDVIVSACENVISSRISPSGRLLYVHQENSGVISAFLLDLQTSESMDTTEQPFSSFLTDDLWFLEKGLDDYIFDRTTGVQYPIEKFVYSRPDGQINLKTNQPLLVESLRQAEQVFLIGASTDTVVALAPNFEAHPEQNFIVEKYDVPDFNTERFLQENGIAYQTVLPRYPHEVVSPNGRLIARDDGIYLVETNQMIVKAPPALVNGWLGNSEGAIYSSYGRCFIHRGLPFADDIGCEIRVRQPILLLKVPEEYLFLNGVQ